VTQVHPHQSRVYGIVSAGDKIWTGSDDTVLQIHTLDWQSHKEVKMGIMIKSLLVVQHASESTVWCLTTSNTSNLTVWNTEVSP
jgi:hypothetical protein